MQRGLTGGSIAGRTAGCSHGQHSACASASAEAVLSHACAACEVYRCQRCAVTRLDLVCAALCLQPTSMLSQKWTTPTWIAAWPPSTPPCWAACAAQPGCAASAAAAGAGVTVSLSDGRFWAGLPPYTYLYLLQNWPVIVRSIPYLPAVWAACAGGDCAGPRPLPHLQAAP